MGLRLADVALESHIPELAPEANLGTLTLARIQQLAVEKAFWLKKCSRRSTREPLSSENSVPAPKEPP
nr:MAG TPA: hypothetical protein [Caudoviricetes sp.]